MIFQTDQWIFWAIIIVGLIAYSILFDTLLNATDELELRQARCQLADSCLAALPLLGLLGTIMGLLQTFADMAADHVDFNTLIAGGVGTALGTTQLGLLFAVPGYLLSHFLKSRFQQGLLLNDFTKELRDEV